MTGKGGTGLLFIEDPRGNISEEAKFVVVGDSKIVIPTFVRKIEE